jgi:hypothetical protein
MIYERMSGVVFVFYDSLALTLTVSLAVYNSRWHSLCYYRTLRQKKWHKKYKISSQISRSRVSKERLVKSSKRLTRRQSVGEHYGVFERLVHEKVKQDPVPKKFRSQQLQMIRDTTVDRNFNARYVDYLRAQVANPKIEITKSTEKFPKYYSTS